MGLSFNDITYFCPFGTNVPDLTSILEDDIQGVNAYYDKIEIRFNTAYYKNDKEWLRCTFKNKTDTIDRQSKMLQEIGRHFKNNSMHSKNRIESGVYGKTFQGSHGTTILRKRYDKIFIYQPTREDLQSICSFFKAYGVNNDSNWCIYSIEIACDYMFSKPKNASIMEDLFRVYFHKKWSRAESKVIFRGTTYTESKRSKTNTASYQRSRSKVGSKKFSTFHNEIRLTGKPAVRDVTVHPPLTKLAC